MNNILLSSHLLDITLLFTVNLRPLKILSIYDVLKGVHLIQQHSIEHSQLFPSLQTLLSENVSHSAVLNSCTKYSTTNQNTASNLLLQPRMTYYNNAYCVSVPRRSIVCVCVCFPKANLDIFQVSLSLVSRSSM